MFAFTIFVIVLLSESIDLFVRVSVDTRDTRVELLPAGNNIVFVTPAECGCALSICPCVFTSQLNCIAPSLPVPLLPLTTTFPAPLGSKFKSKSVSPPETFKCGPLTKAPP